MLHRFLYPGKAFALSRLERVEKAIVELRTEKERLEESLKKMYAEKRSYEYFKNILLKEGTNIYNSSYVKTGRFALVSVEITYPYGYVKVWMSEKDWDGVSRPVPACELAFSISSKRKEGESNGLEIETCAKIGNICSIVPELGAGTLAMESFLRICNQEKFTKITGDLSYGDIENNRDRVLAFYEKFKFTVTPRNDNSNVYADIFKQLS